MSIEKAIEERIREAIARRDFDNLPGKGKPIDLEAYFSTPEDLRIAFAMLKSNDFVPEEVEIAREIGGLKERLAASTDADERASVTRLLNEKALALRLLLERRRRT
jgi:DnaJ-like protein